ncbi:hypothetical protein MBLNU230_g6877t1 [Neophaeotheca triangularis]
MTAVAPPPFVFTHRNSDSPAHEKPWTRSDVSALRTPGIDDSGSMFSNRPPRKTVQRQNSSSSVASSNSSNSTISAPSVQGNGASAPTSEPGGWSIRKKPSRGLWPPGKAEAATGISTARPQSVTSATSGPSASSAISALHAPMLPSQQMANGNGQSNGAIRGQQQAEPPAILHLIPINSTFERKTITVPYYPDVLRIGRQTNQKTIPTPLNGYFDSKVLSRQHAEVYADRQGRIFIRDVKSSNGTFVNGVRLSQENKESEPRELRESDILELGIDIVSEDQKTVVHHKVAAKVEHAGIYAQGNDALSFGDLDPSSGAGIMSNGPQLKRQGSQGSMNGRGPGGMPMNQQQMMPTNPMQQQQQMRNWLSPITTENLMKKLNTEMKLAMQQSQDLARTRQALQGMVGGNAKPFEKEQAKSDLNKVRPSPLKPHQELKAPFSEPPAPPPRAPLPEKPDVARALADPIIQPLLRRTDTARPQSASSSPTRTDHSGDILRLCEELKLAKGEISSQTERMKNLETQLAEERTARESAEERAQRLETGGEHKDSVEEPTTNGMPERSATPEEDKHDSPTSASLQSQLDRLHASMDEMKQQMEMYRRNAETAESERDEARQSLAEMIEQKRTENAAAEALTHRSQSPSRQTKRTAQTDGTNGALSNGHAVTPNGRPASPTAVALMQKAGLADGDVITPEQARFMRQYLMEEVLNESGNAKAAMYQGMPFAVAALVVMVGWAAMAGVNGWPKVER